MSTGQHALGATHPSRQRLVVALAVVGLVLMAATTGVGMVGVGLAVAGAAPQGQKKPGRVTGHAPTATTFVLPLGNASHQFQHHDKVATALASGLASGGLLKATCPTKLLLTSNLYHFYMQSIQASSSSNALRWCIAAASCASCPVALQAHYALSMLLQEVLAHQTSIHPRQHVALTTQYVATCDMYCQHMSLAPE